jgi:hypothetical protein
MNAPLPPQRRKVIQLVATSPEGSPTELYCLADDGSAWMCTHDGRGWYRLDTSAITNGAA